MIDRRVMQQLEPALAARGLTIGYRSGKGQRKTVRSGIDITLYRGELASLIGLNGAGKSTLIRTLCRFQPSFGGEISVMGKDIYRYSTHELALTVGVVLTDRTNAGGLTVRELVALGRQPHTGFFGRLSEEDVRVVTDALAAVGISHKADSYVSELSDGERQRVMIAKALAQECPVIVLDEPTAFLDVTGRMDIMSLLHETARKQNKAVLLSTHDMDNALMFSDRILLLHSSVPGPAACCLSDVSEPAGTVVSGSPEDLVLDGSLSRFFNSRGMDFDCRTGHLSTGISGPQVGVDGDSLTVRWMANALARNGFTPVLPNSGIPCIRCISPTSIEVSFPASKEVTSVSCISQAIRYLIHTDRETWSGG